MSVALSLVVLASLPRPGDAPSDDLLKYVYPLAPRLACPPVETDTRDLPEAEDWARAAKSLVETWYPEICSLLSTQDYKPPKRIRLVFKKKISAPAYASGGTITINGEWIAKHPEDLGMVVHELTHVVQDYPRSKSDTGWLVEGIADYVRWWRYEPETPRSKIDPAKAKFTDSYRTTAWFLAWASQKYDRRLVPDLDLALRKAEDPVPVFSKRTGKDVESLWKEFVEGRK